MASERHLHNLSTPTEGVAMKQRGFLDDESVKLFGLEICKFACMPQGSHGGISKSLPLQITQTSSFTAMFQ